MDKFISSKNVFLSYSTDIEEKNRKVISTTRIIILKLPTILCEKYFLLSLSTWVFPPYNVNICLAILRLEASVLQLPMPLISNLIQAFSKGLFILTNYALISSMHN